MVLIPRKRLLLASLLSAFACLSLGAPQKAWAYPPDVYGLGARSRSMAGATGAEAKDASSVFYNPAGTAGLETVQLTVGYATLAHALNINGVASNVERFGGFNFGLIMPLDLGLLDVAFAVTGILPDQRMARSRSSLVERPRWERFDTRSHRLFVAVTLAFELWDSVRLGGGLAFQAGSKVGLDLRGDIAFPDTAMSQLEHRISGNLASVRYPIVGFQWDIHPMVSVGLTYRGESELVTELVAEAQGDIPFVGGNLAFDFITLNTGNFNAHQLLFQAAVRPLDNLLIDVEVGWLNWSRHGSIIPFERIRIELDPVSSMLIALPEKVKGKDPVPLGLRDTVVPRIGAEYTFKCPTVEYALRAGYFFEPTPYPEQRGVGNFVDSDRHVLSLGGGIFLKDLKPTLGGGIRINIYGLMAHMAYRDHRKTSLVDPVGDYRAGGFQFGIGLDAEVTF